MAQARRPLAAGGHCSRSPHLPGTEHCDPWPNQNTLQPPRESQRPRARVPEPGLHPSCETVSRGGNRHQRIPLFKGKPSPQKAGPVSLYAELTKSPLRPSKRCQCTKETHTKATTCAYNETHEENFQPRVPYKVTSLHPSVNTVLRSHNPKSLSIRKRNDRCVCSTNPTVTASSNNLSAT